MTPALCLALALSALSHAQFRAVSTARVSAGSSAASVTGARGALSISPAAAGLIAPAAAPAAAPSSHYEDMLAAIAEEEAGPASAKRAPVELKGRGSPANHAEDMKAVVDEAIARDDALSAREALNARFDLSDPAKPSSAETAGRLSSGLTALEPSSPRPAPEKASEPPLRSEGFRPGSGSIAAGIDRYLGIAGMGALAAALGAPTSLALAPGAILLAAAFVAGLIAQKREGVALRVHGYEAGSMIFVGAVSGAFGAQALLVGGTMALLALIAIGLDKSREHHGISLLLGALGAAMLLGSFAGPSAGLGVAGAGLTLFSSWAIRQLGWRRAGRKV